MSIQHLFSPRGVAVVGSAAEGKIGYHLIRQIRDGGFDKLYAVNPKAQGALGVQGFSCVSEIQEPVDLVVVVAPAPAVPAVLDDSGGAGVRAAVIITSGFSEVGNTKGEAEIKRIAAKYGMRVVGPNCAGVINTKHRLFAALETRPPSGQVAFVSQSGALGGAVLSWAEEQGLGFSKFLSYGNRVDLDETDLLPFLAQDDETKVLALYVESVADGRAFLDAVRDFTRHKPLVVIKSGRSNAGQRATLSHTGSMAGSDVVYDAVLRDSGALRVNTVEEMFDLCKGFVSLPRVVPTAAADPSAPPRLRLAIVTNSGGPGVMAADRAEELGLAVSEPGPELKERLGRFLPSYCSLRNPIDLTVEGTEETYREALTAVLEEFDAALALDVSTPYLDSVALARGVCAAVEKSGKPVVVNFMAGQIVANAIDYFKVHGMPNYPVGERAVAVLSRLAEYESFKSVNRSWAELPKSQKRLPCDGQLLEPEAMQWLNENGIPTLPFRFARVPSEVVQGCREIGYPVAMKVVSPDILHKSEWDGVKLNIGDDSAAEAAFADIRKSASGKKRAEGTRVAKTSVRTPDAPRFLGVVIYPMVHDAREVLLGASNDSQFGPVVVFGLGGIYSEVHQDISLRVAPVNHEQAGTMIREIRSFPILAGVRGEKPCDLHALADLLVAFSRLPLIYPQISEIDLNPVFVRPEGPVVGDVRVIVKEQVEG